MKLAVLIPHRDREEFKSFLASYLPRFLLERNMDFKVIFCEQKDKELFSRSITLNMAFKFAMLDFQPDYVVTSDVDMVPVKNVNYEWEGENKVWFVNAGGLKCLSSDFAEVNGYNNTFRGWGYEDSEIWKRLDVFGKKVNRWSPPQDCLIVDMEMPEKTDSASASLNYWGDHNPRFITPHEFEPTKGMKKPLKTWYSENKRKSNSDLIESIKAMPEEEMRHYFMFNGLNHTDASKIQVEYNSASLAEISYDSSNCIKAN